jgi:hypothetical protein
MLHTLKMFGVLQVNAAGVVVLSGVQQVQSLRCGCPKLSLTMV